MSARHWMPKIESPYVLDARQIKLNRKPAHVHIGIKVNPSYWIFTDIETTQVLIHR